MPSALAPPAQPRRAPRLVFVTFTWKPGPTRPPASGTPTAAPAAGRKMPSQAQGEGAWLGPWAAGEARRQQEPVGLVPGRRKSAPRTPPPALARRAARRDD